VTADIHRAAKILRAGGLVAFPTETVYGLGADASNAAAVARLYKLKGRPPRHPVIVHFASAEAAFAWAREVPEAARRLARAFWPGPLTLILRRSSRAADFVTGGQDTVGLRVPSHPVALSLLEAFGDGVAAPSANRYGHVSPTTAAHVREDFGDALDAVLEGGASEVGIESTIVDCSRGQPSLLRPGHIGVAELEAALGARLAPRDGDAPRHPGGEARHYAPRTPARLVASHDLDAEIARWGNRAAVLAFSRPDERSDYWLRMPREPAAYARGLYAALRELDSAGAECILIEAPPATAQWGAVRDRLLRAATPARG
jgi:L-threonylcarbamoyladenylate synthase